MKLKFRSHKRPYIKVSVVFGFCCFLLTGHGASADGCVENQASALHPMKGTKGQMKNINLVKFKQDCSSGRCVVRASVHNNDDIADFVLDPKTGFSVCNETKIVEADNPKTGCAKTYISYYQSVGFDTGPHARSAIIFETLETSSPSDRVCSDPDTNDGPALATFSATYAITPSATVYVYELDSYPTIEESIHAKSKYILH